MRSHFSLEAYRTVLSTIFVSSKRSSPSDDKHDKLNTLLSPFQMEAVGIISTG